MRTSKLHGVVILLIIVLATSCVASAGSAMASGFPISAGELWSERADSAQATLDSDFWFPLQQIYFSTSARNQTRNYWWQAHAMDALVMGYRRTGNSFYSSRMSSLYQGIYSSGGFTDSYYDDMEWMALAFLRAYEVTHKTYYRYEANSLWQTIQGGWSDFPGGGGFQWSTKVMYKNVPANAPACILACKLYEDLGDTTDLSWAEKIHAWVAKNLVNPQTGIILDGISYQDSVGTPNYGSYSYNYGTYLGASLSLFQITGDSTYLREAEEEANVADTLFATSDGVLKSEGTGDGGLFNGIYVYYLAKLIRQLSVKDTLGARYDSFLFDNADTLWEHGRQPGAYLFNDDWEQPPSGSVSLSVDLSGVTLLESVAYVLGDTAVTAVLQAPTSVPQKFSLSQNYPNPFNPSTEIKVALDRPGSMSLDIYNVLGQLVKVVAEGYRPAGEYTFDVSMNSFASGAYFYTLREGTEEITRKMLLLK